MTNLIIFDCNDANNKIIIKIDQSLIDLECFCTVTVMLCLGVQKYILDIFDLYESMLALQKVLKQALCNQLQLHPSINKDLGFIFNQYMYYSYQEKEFTPASVLVYDINDIWVGKYYQLWGSKKLTTWLYNTDAGAIVFEVTPLYPKKFSAASFNHKQFYEWMSDYKPFYIMVLSKENAQDWLNKAEALIYEMESVYKKRS